MELIIATQNLHKVREFRAILKPLLPHIDILSLLDFPNYVAPEETGITFEENAFLKASSAAKTLKRWVLADDSGLVVPALNDDPGVRSARYSGENATDKENRDKLLREIEKLSENDRIGYYACALTLASPEGTQKQVKGMCEGTLIMKPRGNQGFGYDSMFIKYDYNKTFAEMDDDTKNRISHRRKAIEKILPSLEQLNV